MNKKIILGFIIFLVMIFITACEKPDPASDFTVEPVDGGKSVKITGYIGLKQDVKIPSKINNLFFTHIGEEAFKDKNLTSVIIPDSITTIEDRAFDGNKLTSIELPKSVISIGNSAFANNLLTNVILHDFITEIGSDAFNNNPLAGDFVFEINNDHTITIIDYIGTELDLSNPDLIPKTIIGWPVTNVQLFDRFPLKFEGTWYRNEFRNRLTFTTYNLKASNQNFIWAFHGVDRKLYSIKVNDVIATLTIELINDNLVISGDSGSGENNWNGTWMPYQDPKNDDYIIEINESETGKTITILEYIGNDSIVIIPSVIQNIPVTSIGHHAFYGNSSLTSIIIPNSITYIGGSIFARCSYLSRITFEGTLSESNYHRNIADNYDDGGDLREKYLAGGKGTYIRSSTGTWTKQ